MRRSVVVLSAVLIAFTTTSYTVAMDEPGPSTSASSTASLKSAALPGSLAPSGGALPAALDMKPSPSPPIPGAMGQVTLDASGVPENYTVVQDDTTEGIQLRFGISAQHLAKANKVSGVHTVGVNYFLHLDDVVALQVKPVDINSGTGPTVKNHEGAPIFYTTVDGDTFDSLGYQFRISTEALLRYNRFLPQGSTIPAGTKIALMPNELTIRGAQGPFTADSNDVPLSYTTAAGDIDSQVAARFNLEIVQLLHANRPLDNSTPAWFAYTDHPSGELQANQTISLSGEHPIQK
ncbi:lytic transglycosylase [Arthrobacter glacialis]|uniref:lytic transglycosylase n=1 Tax=Arthrobacter glacialis TaxID=1664 RepID=UPI0010571C1F|nr:LysM peptidoglycan-binding domain-containing protein [Arthrobacter glacialis]